MNELGKASKLIEIHSFRTLTNLRERHYHHKTVREILSNTDTMSTPNFTLYGIDMDATIPEDTPSYGKGGSRSRPTRDSN
jgi:hypothetical protein